MATMRDPAFIAEMHGRNLTIDALDGEALQRLIEKAAATPKGLVEQARNRASATGVRDQL